MSIIVNLDIMMARRKISLTELAEKIDITPANLSILKTGKAKAVRFSTLEAICKVLDCQPGIYWSIGRRNRYSIMLMPLTVQLSLTIFSCNERAMPVDLKSVVASR